MTWQNHLNLRQTSIAELGFKIDKAIKIMRLKFVPKINLSNSNKHLFLYSLRRSLKDLRLYTDACIITKIINWNKLPGHQRSPTYQKTNICKQTSAAAATWKHLHIDSKLVKINYCKSSEMENLFLISSLSTFLKNIIFIFLFHYKRLLMFYQRYSPSLLRDKFVPINQHILRVRACIVIE